MKIGYKENKENDMWGCGFGSSVNSMEYVSADTLRAELLKSQIDSLLREIRNKADMNVLKHLVAKEVYGLDPFNRVEYASTYPFESKLSKLQIEIDGLLGEIRGKDDVRGFEYLEKARCVPGLDSSVNYVEDACARVLQAKLSKLQRDGLLGEIRGKALDVGCGKGKGARVLRELGAEEVWGIDISKEYIDIAVKNGVLDKDKAIVDTVYNIDKYFSEKYFDVVGYFCIPTELCSEESIYREICKILKEEGTIILTTIDTEYEPEAVKRAISSCPIEGKWTFYNDEILGLNEQAIYVGKKKASPRV